MKTTEYEKLVASRWKKLKGARALFVMTAGLGGEAGEVLDILKKHVRDGKLDKAHLKEELGDVMFYLTKITLHHGFTLNEVMQGSYDKIHGKPQRGH